MLSLHAHKWTHGYHLLLQVIVVQLWHHIQNILSNMHGTSRALVCGYSLSLQIHVTNLVIPYRWFSARLQQLQYLSNGYTAVLHSAIDTNMLQWHCSNGTIIECRWSKRQRYAWIVRYQTTEEHNKVWTVSNFNQIGFTVILNRHDLYHTTIASDLAKSDPSLNIFVRLSFTSNVPSEARAEASVHLKWQNVGIVKLIYFVPRIYCLYITSCLDCLNVLHDHVIILSILACN